MTVTLQLVDRAGKRSVRKKAVAAVRPNPDADRIACVEGGLIDDSGNTGTLVARMAFHDVPGVAIAVIDGFCITWAKAYGVRREGRPETANNETLFQVASISKPVSVLAAVRMMHEGLIDGDADVNSILTSWQVPGSGFTASQKVTLRRLATHTGGFTLQGFLGYREGSPYPTSLEILDGRPPANSPPIRVGFVPGSSFVYSGGGSQVLQQVLTDVAGMPFVRLMREWVLGPTRMHHSTFAQPLPAARRGNAAAAHELPLAEEAVGQVHPEMAAAGLWSTASDLARHVLALIDAYRGRGPEELPRQMVRDMLTENLGGMAMGWFVDSSGDDTLFNHAGANLGFRAIVVGLPERGAGAVILTNGANGDDLYDEILQALGREYGLGQ